MKLSKFLLGVAICTASSLLWVSCQKNDLTVNTPKDNVANLKTSGVVPDDPAKVAKVPMIMSAEFLAASKDALLADPMALLSGQIVPSATSGRGGNDRTKPSVSITSPSTGATVSGTVTIQVSASDNVGVSLVTVSVDGVSLANKATAPYGFSWNTSGVASGTHTISAIANDAAGNSSSTSIQVGINAAPSGDLTAPTVSIMSPSTGSSVTVGATVTVSVSAADNIGVSAVSFNVDGALQTTSSTSPYSFSWNTTGAASGIHTLTATARDAAGNSSSNSIQVTTNTTILPPPPAPLPASFQLVMPPVQNQGGEGICVPFATAYAARSTEQFYKTNASSYSYATNIFSPEFVYDQIKTSDCGSGTGVTTALDFMVSSGVCTWQSMPYSSSNGCSLFPTTSQSTEASSYKITSYSTIAVSDITAIKTMVVNHHALIITVGTDDSFWNAQPGFIWKSYSGPMGISHSLVICGYDDSKHAYKVMNSWGITWGDAGFSWIDYDFLPQSAAYYSYVING